MRTAVLTISNRVSRRQAQRWAAQEAPAYPQEPQYYAPPPQAPPPAAPAAAEDRVEQLKELAALKQQGVLTDDEFAAEKARILSG